MVFKPISASILRKAAEDAEKRGQYGLIIWPSEVKWRSLHRFLDANNPIIIKIAEYLQSNQMCWVGFVKGDISLTPKEGYALVVPAHKVASYGDYRKKILKLCPSGIAVPISMLPSMHLSAIHLNPTLS